MKRTTKVIAVIVMITCIVSSMAIASMASVCTTYKNETSVIYSQNGLSEYMIVGRMPSNISPNNNAFIQTTGTLPRDYYSKKQPSGQYFYDQSSPTNPSEIGSIISSPFFINLNTETKTRAQLRLANQMWYTLNGETTAIDEVHSVSIRYKDFIIKQNVDLEPGNSANETELASIHVTDEQAEYIIEVRYTVTIIKNGEIRVIPYSNTITLDGVTVNNAVFNVISPTFEDLTDPSSRIYLPEEYKSDNGECLVNDYVFTIYNKDRDKDTIDDFHLNSTYTMGYDQNDIEAFYLANGITETIIKVETVEADFTEWLSTAVWSIMNFEIFPGLKIYFIVGFVVAIAIMKIFLKMFAGG